VSTPADLEIGEALPSQERRPTNVSVFLYAAALWTPHRIHYDRDHAQSEGNRDILVHGPLLASYLIQSVTDWLGPAGRVTRFDYRNLGPAYPGEVFRTHAVLRGRAESRLTFHLRLEREGEPVVEGEAEVELFAGGA
jgi:hydroxyacyl-ACP dehydratase HTD2-like protein with hotdog domain